MDVKSLKLKLPRVIASFQLCRSNQPSIFHEDPIRRRSYPLSDSDHAVSRKVSDICYPTSPAPPPLSTVPENCLSRGYVSSKIISVGCGCRSKSWAVYFSKDYSNKLPRDSAWDDKEAGMNVTAPKSRRKVKNSKSVSGEIERRSPPSLIVTEKKTEKKENLEGLRNGTATSMESRSWSLGYEGEEDEDSEALLSFSRSFSNDFSYEFFDPAKTISEKTNSEISTSSKKNKKKNKTEKVIGGCNSKKHGKASSSSYSSQITENESDPAWRGTAIWQVIPNKVSDSFIMVKKSEEPHDDFKRSMMEMILEKEIFETKDLEELLQCFLSLNSTEYHGVILQAFSEIWDVLFCDSLVRQ